MSQEFYEGQPLVGSYESRQAEIERRMEAFESGRKIVVTYETRLIEQEEIGVEFHMVAVPAHDRPFVWCPRGRIRGYHPEDVNKRYCAWCSSFFEDMPL